MLNIIAVAIGIYGAFVGALYFLQRGLIYYPGGPLPPPAAAGLPEMREITVTTGDGLTLTSWYRAAADGRPTIVYFHGNGGDISGREVKVRPYLDRGFGVLMAEYRGYGGNPGKPTEDGLYDDGRANLAFLAAEGVKPGRWVLYGESLGTGVAVHLAGEQAARAPGGAPGGAPVGALVLESAFTSLGEAAAIHYPVVPARLLVKDRFDSLAKIGAVGTPVLFLHGESDGLIPVQQGKALYEEAAEPKQGRWIPGGGHNDLYDFGIADTVVEFIDRHLGPNQ